MHPRYHAYHSISWLVIWSGNNCSRTGRAIWILPRAIVPVSSKHELIAITKASFTKMSSFTKQIFSTFLHFTLIPSIFAEPNWAARPWRICQVFFISVAALVLIIMGATWPSSGYDLPIPHILIVLTLGVLTIFSVLNYFFITCQKARFPHTCDARKDQSIWL